MIDRSKVLEIVKRKGPLLPGVISKETRENLLMASAMLSELVSANKLKISNLKIGSSPLYYLEGQEGKLQEYSEKLPGHQREAYNKISQQKLLKDSQLNPGMRVAIRELKDFAFPVIITSKGKRELYWKWYLSPTEEIHSIIKNKFMSSEPHRPAQIEPVKIENNIKLETPKPAPIKKESVQKIKEETKEKKSLPEKEQPKQTEEEEKILRLKRTIEEERKLLDEEKKRFLEEKKELEKKKKELKEPAIEEDPFFQEVKAYLTTKQMRFDSVSIVKKGAEIEFKTNIKSEIGEIPFICRAKSKKRMTKKELEDLHSYALEKKLPVLLLLKGDLTKKTAQLIQEEFPLIQFQKIGG